MSDAQDDKPTHCLLGHRMFSMFRDPVFRRTDTDATPVLVVRMGEREATMPLRSIQRELGITDDSADGQMLILIADALDFVPLLRIGDKLPPEVLDGGASWAPEPHHLRRALMRLHMQLVAWMQGTDQAAPTALDADSIARAENDPVLRQHIQEAFQRAAEALGLASKEAVIAQLESLAGELAYIEALRDRLLERVRAMAGAIERMVRGVPLDAGQRSQLNGLAFLGGEALRQLSHRFDEQDAQAGEVMAVLRHLESHRGFIRSNRDWLYRSHLAWEPILAGWDKALEDPSADRRGLLTQTYQFLARRYMPVTEWLKATKAPKKADIGVRMMW